MTASRRVVPAIIAPFRVIKRYVANLPSTWAGFFLTIRHPIIRGPLRATSLFLP